MCLGIQKPKVMAINAFSLTWINNDFYMFHLQPCRLNINVQPGPLVFLVVTKKFDIATENLQVPPAMQKTKKL